MISFRPLQFNDLFMMFIWLNSDNVKKWWKNSSTLEDVVNEYGKKITKEEPDDSFIIVIDGLDIGYIQTYLYCDFDEKYYKLLDATEHTAGVDLFIGHKDYIHKGYGKHIMRQFLNDYVFNNPRVDDCVITPEPNNIAAIKMYEKSGYKWYKTINRSDDEAEHLMILTKKDYLLDPTK